MHRGCQWLRVLSMQCGAWLTERKWSTEFVDSPRKIRMNVQWSLLVVVATFLGGGCSSTDGQRSHSFRSGYPVSDAQYVPLRNPGNPVNCPGHGDANACVIPITVTDQSCDADKIVLDDFVNLGNFAQKKKVAWVLPAGYVFCPRAGTGCFSRIRTLPTTCSIQRQSRNARTRLSGNGRNRTQTTRVPTALPNGQ